MNLKDYRQMEHDRIYYFDNLSLHYDGNTLFSKYPIEEFWYPFYEDSEWFKEWENRDLTVTEKFV